MVTLRTRAGKKATGFVFYNGPSLLDGSPVVGIATGLDGSGNRKTGAMVQIYFLRSDVAPMQALRTGSDVSICGDCKHRAGACYVRVEQGPTVVYKSFLAGNYPQVDSMQARALLAGKTVRLGAYGDPASVPASLLAELVRESEGWTGYTHQWKQAPELRALCMASVDTHEEYETARALGWRCFYVVPKTHVDRVAGAFLCPASEEGGKKLNCIDCLACNGTGGKATASVYIPVHGASHKQTRFNNLVQIERR